MVCKDVKKGPRLSFTPESNDKLRADINVLSFWQILQTEICWCKSFLPCRSKLLEAIAGTSMKIMEDQKKRKYIQ